MYKSELDLAPKHINLIAQNAIVFRDMQIEFAYY